ncbi:class I SAM-dependent methyltransferase [Crossiella sp. CA-258035]|uniref:SAM-dependent methyltransferase n=1 Tax=Crossiella sp. CA-258035 TaxID=2981138 RepID=UPI0024BC2EB2|nr:class I SAM-dependent methyltransferase [Crossiella sp. CA-258035]WHT22002.1 class I SAM-dependent methyltransferase [Crossiella sp. CA-258035]
MAEFDATGLFDQDYLDLYGADLDARADAEAGLLWRLLELRPGLTVLDLACGHGRLSNRLAARGCRVTGLDITPVFLDRARAEAAGSGLQVDYVLGDMRELPWSGEFDRVVNWFSSFGYFADADNRRVLAEVRRVLRPGGRFALETMHLIWLLRHFRESVRRELPDGTVVLDEHRLDAATARSVGRRTVSRNGQDRVVSYFIRLFAYPELADWLRAAGFAEVTGFGPDGEPLTAASRRLIVVADSR